MSYSHILFDVDAEGVARITVNRPDKLNALNRETMNQLADAFTRAQSDAAVGGVILTGSGEKAFVAGADINELAVLTPIEAHALSARGQAILRALECMPKPSVAGWNWRWPAPFVSLLKTLSWASPK